MHYGPQWACNAVHNMCTWCVQCVAYLWMDTKSQKEFEQIQKFTGYTKWLFGTQHISCWELPFQANRFLQVSSVGCESPS
mmetsp:Transcript_13069/g.23877  ORF Transcript_13069/g.23877 Transcript_13069/m.23877 type:complete len:80 (+) Transcript_13069:605-844(+)